MTRVAKVLKGKTVPVDDSLDIYDEMAKSPNVVVTDGPKLLPGAKVLATETPRDKHPVIDRLVSGLQESEGGRTQLGNKLWAAITAVVTEYASIDDGETTVLTTSPNVTGYVQIDSFVASVPSGATGTLQLGPITIYLPAGVTNATGLTVQLDQTDVRSLTVSAAGATSLLLCGHVSPMSGQLPV